jgi:hypothetical protein
MDSEKRSGIFSALRSWVNLAGIERPAVGAYVPQLDGAPTVAIVGVGIPVMDVCRQLFF